MRIYPKVKFMPHATPRRRNAFEPGARHSRRVVAPLRETKVSPLAFFPDTWTPEARHFSRDAATTQRF